MVGLRTVQLLVQVFTLTPAGYNNHKCHNKKPQIGNGTRLWMTSWPEVMSWEFWWFWKAVSWDSTLGEVSWDLTLGEASWDILTLGWAASWGLTEGGCRHSQHSKNYVCLSLCRKTKSKKKVNKRFIPELKKVVSDSGFLCIWTFYIFVSWICHRWGVSLGKLIIWFSLDNPPLCGQGLFCHTYPMSNIFCTFLAVFLIFTLKELMPLTGL